MILNFSLQTQVLLWQRKLSEVLPDLITQTGILNKAQRESYGFIKVVVESVVFGDRCGIFNTIGLDAVYCFFRLRGGCQ